MFRRAVFSSSSVFFKGALGRWERARESYGKFLGNISLARRTLGDEAQFQVIDDPVDHRIVSQVGDDAHLSAALGADQRVNFIDLTDHLGPALGRDGPELLLEYPERERHQARLLDLPAVGIGVETVISDSDLPLIRDMRSDSGDELQVVHPLRLVGFFPIPVGDPACPIIEGEKAFRPFGTEDLPADKISENLSAKELRQP
jgi:hypothetical protein